MDQVTRRLADSNLAEIIRMERLARGDEGLSPVLVEAVGAAEETLPEAARARVAQDIAGAFARLRITQEHYPGATLVAYGVALACRRFTKLAPEQVHELTWRWDKATDQRVEAAAAKLNLRAIGDRFLSGVAS